MLSDILALVQEAAELPGNDAVTRAQVLRYVNFAAKAMYQANDLRGSLCEQFFETTEDRQSISLPWYVDEVRAMRRHNSRARMTVESFEPRYIYNPWRQPYNRVRVLRRTPLHTPLAVESQLTFTLLPQEEPVDFTVIGQTSTAARIREVVRIEAGDATGVTDNQFVKDDPLGIVEITKSIITTVDVSVTSTEDDEEVATLPSHMPRANNTIVMMNDDESGVLVNGDNVIEVFYKRPFVPMYYDADTFCFPPLEEAIVLKARAYVYSLSKDPERQAQAQLLNSAADKLAIDVINTSRNETADEVNVAPNPLERAAEKSMCIGSGPSDGNGFAW